MIYTEESLQKKCQDDVCFIDWFSFMSSLPDQELTSFSDTLPFLVVLNSSYIVWSDVRLYYAFLRYCKTFTNTRITLNFSIMSKLFIRQYTSLPLRY
jgi:hypothetical protein